MNIPEKKYPVGYTFLIEYLKGRNIQVTPPYRESCLAKIGDNLIWQTPDVIYYFYRSDKYTITNGLFQNIEFALKHEGLNLEIFKALFNVITEKEITNYISDKKTGRYNRIVWFLYEWLIEKNLDIEDVPKTNYIDLLDDKKYYTAKPNKHKRYCINENLLGNRHFCPIVRKTKTILDFDEKDLHKRAEDIIKNNDTKIVYRAINFLYSKESKSSFEIEHEKPSNNRLAKFQKILEELSTHSFIVNKQNLINLQNIIVPDKFKESDYRKKQIFVGSTGINSTFVDYIAPKTKDVETLMQGFFDCYERLISSDLPAVVIAGAISFGFVYIHPFEDGNGRIHRFLIHHVFSQKNFTPQNALFPVSATMLEKRNKYDAALETFSKKIMSLIDYSVLDNRLIEVKNETIDYYRYIDYTKQTEYLYECVEDTINSGFLSEISYLSNYDRAKTDIQAYIDLPDRLIDLFIKYTVANKGNLSNNKKRQLFSGFTDQEINRLEEIVNNHFKEYIESCVK